MQPFDHFAHQYRERTDQVLTDRLNSQTSPHSRLDQAMRYSLFNGGKRVRPLLAYAAALAIDEPNTLTDTAAAAIECIHAYSLIHDDLPAMDDDELRRGQPTCHIAFDEATAILAGDALQTLAFEWVSEQGSQSSVSSDVRLQMLHLLAKASGDKGMVAGQSIDLCAVDHQLNLEQLTTMHNLKTGALIHASVQLGALSTAKATDDQLNGLQRYAQAIGLAFQIQDDILDVTGDTQTLGKQQGADLAHNKPTFVSLLGLEQAKTRTNQLYEDALNALSSFDYRADYLRHLAGYIIKRRY